MTWGDRASGWAESSRVLNCDAERITGYLQPAADNSADGWKQGGLVSPRATGSTQRFIELTSMMEWRIEQCPWKAETAYAGILLLYVALELTNTAKALLRHHRRRSFHSAARFWKPTPHASKHSKFRYAIHCGRILIRRANPGHQLAERVWTFKVHICYPFSGRRLVLASKKGYTKHHLGDLDGEQTPQWAQQFYSLSIWHPSCSETFQFAIDLAQFLAMSSWILLEIYRCRSRTV